MSPTPEESPTGPTTAARPVLRKSAMALSLLTAVCALGWGIAWWRLAAGFEPAPGMTPPPLYRFVVFMFAGAIASVAAAALVHRGRGWQACYVLCGVALVCAGFTLPRAEVLWTVGLAPLIGARLAWMDSPKPPEDDEGEDEDDGDGQREESDGAVLAESTSSDS